MDWVKETVEEEYTRTTTYWDLLRNSLLSTRYLVSPKGKELRVWGSALDQSMNKEGRFPRVNLMRYVYIVPLGTFNSI